MVMKVDLERKLLSRKEAAAILGVSRDRVVKLVDAGELDEVDLGPRSRRITLTSIKVLLGEKEDRQ